MEEWVLALYIDPEMNSQGWSLHRMLPLSELDTLTFNCSCFTPLRKALCFTKSFHPGIIEQFIPRLGLMRGWRVLAFSLNG